MPITLLDGILAGFTLVSAMLAMVRGFSREVLSIASWAAAAVAAYLFYKPVVPYVQPYIDNEKIAMGAAAGIVFLIALIVVSIITMKIADWIIDSRVGALDRTLGFLYGAARGVLVVAVGLMFFNWLAGEKAPNWVAESKSRPLLESIGKYIESVLPEDPEKTILKQLNKSGVVPNTGTPPAGTLAPTPEGTVPENNEAPAPDDEAPADQPPAGGNAPATNN
ncbi:MAG TPA: CvpA family protein [Mesorhizobium sp.]|jgi:membrane protein required for colicin V production|uniref:CvpA family protein n=1 Tax=Mesorhizobium sp. TaxID=1871066 RepID=UPI002DDD7640|nr:CvpA family protein [Mesorhizobium sp.]HEV2503367.1 CvpA family protein [Mesorhizobium sp.]